ncbi:hypothetical protein [Gallaecimonas sp. GXIMD4217]|uniref:hypothetical protein n=1 Tax=Gallaecimonas sp. GXIMD4217 TaxID=3131927 RepID=UPI00311AC548
MKVTPLLVTTTALLLSAATTAATYTVSPDEDSCWDPPNWCVEAQANWSEHTQGKLVVTYTNVCQHRVYLRKCNARKDGTEDCGAGGLSGGRSTKWSTTNASGEYNYNFVGVLNGSKDWVCTGKVPNWRD